VGRKKRRRKRSREPQKNIWLAVKDNAAIVAALIGLFGIGITGALNTYIANQNQIAQRELEQERAQETALQTYLTEIGDLILDDSSPLSEASGGDGVSRLARAKTLTVLLGLDGGRERILLQFLKEEALINTHKPIVSLSGADLSGANLSGADLCDVALNDVDLRDADLSCLVEKTPQGVFKTCVNLSGSDLSGANLRGANLSSANLSGAELIEVNLEDANLSNVDLSNADLSGALGVTQEKLLSAESLEGPAESLEGATMPDGSIHD
jgi:uncharacterized protein YjbI with pentapeptide repeats